MEGLERVAEAVQGHRDGLLLDPVTQLHASGGGDRLIQQCDLRAVGHCFPDLRVQVAHHPDPCAHAGIMPAGGERGGEVGLILLGSLDVQRFEQLDH